MKSLAKTVVQIVALAIVAPFWLTHVILSACTDADASMETHSQLFSLIPGKVGSYLRVAFYRLTLQHCDPSATICFGVLFSKAGACVHQNAYIGPRCMLGLVTLEQDVLLGPAVQIPSGPATHGIASLETPIRQQKGNQVRITVGWDSWIGAGSIVLADVGAQSVVGAGSIVTKPTEPRTISVGNPARLLCKRGQWSIVPNNPTPGASATQVDEVCANQAETYHRDM